LVIRGHHCTLYASRDRSRGYLHRSRGFWDREGWSWAQGGLSYGHENGKQASEGFG